MSKAEVDPKLGLVLALEAVTFGIASYLHRGGRISLGFTTIHGESFTGAATPEAIIGAVLAIGAVAVLMARPHARGIALAGTGFAILGVLIGLSVVLSGTRSRSAADYIYHVGILPVLVVTLMALVRGAGRESDTVAGRHGPTRHSAPR